MWGYGAVKSASKNGLLLHNAPSLTIEAKWNTPVRVKWINDLKDANGSYRPHLLPVDPTLHWANPPGGTAGRDERPSFSSTPGRYTGPVPIVTHLHGSADVGDESDGYAEAWFLPDLGESLPDGYANRGTWYDFFAGKAATNYGVTWGAGFAIFQYPNSQRASTIWYHDHTLGMTRLNVYAGPAGFFIIRGGPAGDTAVLAPTRTGGRVSSPAMPSSKTACPRRCKPRGTDAPILISGQPGSGKKQLARAIHHASGRREEPFPVLASATWAQAGLDELFGAPAFSAGASGRVPGTVFLDEGRTSTASNRHSWPNGSSRPGRGRGSLRPRPATCRPQSPRAISARTSTTGLACCRSRSRR